MRSTHIEIDRAWQALSAVEKTIAEMLDPAIIGVCRLRMASLLGNERETKQATSNLPPDKAAALIQSPAGLTALAESEQACLAFAEQFLLDVTAIDDELVRAVGTHMGRESLYLFARWIQLNEARQRAELVVRRDHHARRSPQ